MTTTLEDEIWKYYVGREDRAARLWQPRWGWILDDYKQLKKELMEVSEGSTLLRGLIKVKEKDHRSLGQIPRSVNHEYGWLCMNPEFQLQKIPDRFPTKPLPDVYRIFKNFD